MSERDRLTELLVDTIHEWECDVSKETVTEIAEHLIENGVIVPPCKVGNTIYQIDGVRIYQSTIHEITYTSSKVIFVTENIVFDERTINNSIFLTREEAEKALKEMGEK